MDSACFFFVYLFVLSEYEDASCLPFEEISQMLSLECQLTHVNIFTLPTLAFTLLNNYFCFFFFFLMIYLLLNILLSSVYFTFNNSLCCSFIVSILFGSLLVNFGNLLFCQNFKFHWQGWYTFLLDINFGLAWLADTWTSCKLPSLWLCCSISCSVLSPTNQSYPSLSLQYLMQFVA